MESNERKIIDQLFQKLAQIASQSGPRDPEAEALIKQHVDRIPGADYYLAQTIIVQQQALKKAEAELNKLQQRRSSQEFRPQQPAQPGPAQPASSGGGFLAGAAQTALGIGGGILIANAGMALVDDIFDDSDAEDLFEAFGAGYEEAAVDTLVEDEISDALEDDLVGDLGGLDDLDLDDW